MQEFRGDSANFPWPQEAETPISKGLVTEFTLRDSLKQVSLDKSLGLNGQLYKLYLRMLPMFVPILMDLLNHWFAQGLIPVCITKGVITLLKKGDRYVGMKLDNYKPITLLNTKLKIFARVLMNRLQLVASYLIGPVQNYAVKGRLI